MIISVTVLMSMMFCHFFLQSISSFKMPSDDSQYSDDIIPGRYCIDYKCANNHTWRSFTGKSGKKNKNRKICNKCNTVGIPTCRPLKKGVSCQSA